MKNTLIFNDKWEEYMNSRPEDEDIPEPKDKKTVTKCRFEIKKFNNDQMLAFGWANVAVRASGEQIEDWQEDIVDPEELEKAAYQFVELYREGGEMHERGGAAVLIESCVFTKEKMAAMKIPEGTLPEGWWIGFKVLDPDVWEKVKDGTYSMFSIEGEAVREKVEKRNIFESVFTSFYGPKPGTSAGALLFSEILQGYSYSQQPLEKNKDDTEHMTVQEKTAVFDFDGVIHSYTSGWQGADVIPDPPVDGIAEVIQQLRDEGYRVVVVSARASEDGGKEAILNWLDENGIEVDEVTSEKPPAVAYVDDLAIEFDGDVEDLIDRIKGKKSWTEQIGKSLFYDILRKYNPYHDRLGRFSTANGAASFSIPKDPKLRDRIIGREREKARADTLNKIESQIKQQSYESLYIVDKNGEIITQKDGTKNEVSFTTEEALKWKDSTLTHNHPGGTVFSEADIMTCINYELQEIRAVGSTGITYTFKRTIQAKDKNSREVAQFFIDMETESKSAWVKAREKVDKYYKMDYYNNKVDLEFMNRAMSEYYSDIMREWFKKNAPKIGCEYKDEGMSKLNLIK